jgi:mannitol-1-phosphate 5-dehydrogenase
VVIKSALKEEILVIENVRGVKLGDSEKAIHELATSGVAALSVGQPGLPETLPLIGSALIRRRELFGKQALDFIICENMRNADRYIADGLGKLLPEEFPFSEMVGLVETSIGKMVPIMTREDLEEDPLRVFAEPYNTLIVSKSGFRNSIPAVEDLAPKENIKAWVDRKLFIHNLGHATAAYLGYAKHPEAIYMYEIFGDADIESATRSTMRQSAEILRSMYPGEFTCEQLNEHIEDLLYRFRNRALGDTVFRVGCDLHRKLGPSDRLVAPIKAAIKVKKPYDLIINALKAAILFRATDEHGNHLPNDISFFREAEKGVDHVLKKVCRLSYSTIKGTEP